MGSHSIGAKDGKDGSFVPGTLPHSRSAELILLHCATHRRRSDTRSNKHQQIETVLRSKQYPNSRHTTQPPRHEVRVSTTVDEYRPARHLKSDRSRGDERSKPPAGPRIIRESNNSYRSIQSPFESSVQTTTTTRPLKNPTNHVPILSRS